MTALSVFSKTSARISFRSMSGFAVRSWPSRYRMSNATYVAGGFFAMRGMSSPGGGGSRGGEVECVDREGGGGELLRDAGDFPRGWEVLPPLEHLEARPPLPHDHHLPAQDRAFRPGGAP